jgi:SH3-like domain-containing protein
MLETAPSPLPPSPSPSNPVKAPNRRRHPGCARALWLPCLWLACLWLAALASGPAAAQDESLDSGDASLPRFASLKSDEVNLRTGPGTRYPIDWIYRRRGLPVEIVDEFEDWRRVRDHDGTMGWVHRFMLASHRTVLVTGGTRMLRRQPSDAAPGLAYLQAGVVANLEDCQQAWCRIEAQGFDGWLRRSELFGTNADD